MLATTLGGRREEEHEMLQLVGAGWEDLFLNVQ